MRFLKIITFITCLLLVIKYQGSDTPVNNTLIDKLSTQLQDLKGFPLLVGNISNYESFTNARVAQNFSPDELRISIEGLLGGIFSETAEKYFSGYFPIDADGSLACIINAPMDQDIFSYENQDIVDFGTPAGKILHEYGHCIMLSSVKDYHSVESLIPGVALRTQAEIKTMAPDMLDQYFEYSEFLGEVHSDVYSVLYVYFNQGKDAALKLTKSYIAARSRTPALPSDLGHYTAPIMKSLVLIIDSIEGSRSEFERDPFITTFKVISATDNYSELSEKTFFDRYKALIENNL